MKTNTKVNMKWIIIVTIVLCSTISAHAQFGSGNSVNIKALLIYERADDGFYYKRTDASFDDVYDIKKYYAYDKKTKTYKRYQFGDEHIDVVDGKQVAVTNIIFQNVSSAEYEGTQYLNLGIEGSGEGKFFTNGKMIDISWKKDGDITRYYNKDGEEIRLNPGKTWVCIIEEQHAKKSEFKAKAE